jgi:hypothetical protein
MQTINLSDDARNLLLRRIAGERVAVAPDNLESYRELATSGLMEPTSGYKREPESWFCLTVEGGRIGCALAAAKYLPQLSDHALRLLQSHLAAIGQRNGGTSGMPTDETREAYRELARAGLMDVCSTFARGPESLYRISDEAYNRRKELSAIHRSRFTPSAVARKIFRAFSLICKGVSAARSTTSS